MKICVCLKQTPSREAPVHIDKDSLWVREQDCRFETNEADQYALEQALCLKDSETAEVVALSYGPARVIQTLKEALAKGADRAIHICDATSAPKDPLQLATAIAFAVKDQHFDLLLTGLQSDDLGFGQTAIIIAERLGLPHASMVMKLIYKKNSLQIERELEAGWRQTLELPLPCVLSIQSGVNKPRYANMKGILAAKKKTIEKIEAASLLSVDNVTSQVIGNQIIKKIYEPQKLKQTVMLKGEPDSIATELLNILNIGTTY